MLTNLTACTSPEIVIDHGMEEKEEEQKEETGEDAVAENDMRKDEPDNSVGDEFVYIHLCGQVHMPGVFKVREGTRLYEVVELAGGFLEDASQISVNLAQEVRDGMMIYIPTVQEAEEAGLIPATDLDSLSSENVDATSTGLVNINTADLALLCTLPGVGETRAKAIIAYRENHGAFSSIEDIKKVSGIGDSTFENLKAFIQV